jgi:hypothetical protein
MNRLAAALTAFLLILSAAAGAAPAYDNFKVAIYVPAGAVQAMREPAVREAQYRRIASQLKFDKVYLETFRNGQLVDEPTLEAVKKFFAGHGMTVAGGIAYSGPERGGQFTTLDYEDPADRSLCQKAAEMAARHFDEVILDDFFFYTSKSAADIAAKGKRSWTEYRLEKMREVSEDLVLKPARAVNARVKITIKYPNWYEHFQGLGYDLDVEAKQFDAIYTGTETRDPEITDQLLQQYESYGVFRFFENVRPGANRGGWVDTYDTRYVDRYAEQLWDTLFARAPEITLFNWADLASPAPLQPGERQGWSSLATSFDWNAMVHSLPAAAGAPGWARAAGYSLETADRLVGKLGRPLGIASYKPFQSRGEDYLHNYLGNIGIPIELTPRFPEQAPLVLLTQSAAADPDLVAKIKKHLDTGRSVVITSGLLHALEHRGITDIAEVGTSDRKIAVHEFIGAHGAGRGVSLDEAGKPTPAILYPEIHFYTNDAWPLIRGVAEARGVPILLMDSYSRATLYILNIPDNPGDLYRLPQPVTRTLRDYLLADFPVKIDAPSKVALFVYDNGSFVVQSYRDEPAKVSINLPKASMVHDLLSGESLHVSEAADAGGQRFSFTVQPHSFRGFATH